MNQPPVTPDILLAAYAQGYFPMAISRDSSELHWFHPERRGVLPLEQFHVPRSLQKFLRRTTFKYSVNKAFHQVIRACAQPRRKNPDTWINDSIVALYSALYDRGHAHSIEVWHEGNLVGGLYGVAIGGAFFGESMFSLRPNASKAALVYLVEKLRRCGYRLLDAQYVNEHLRQFGVEEINRAEYLKRLEAALDHTPEGLDDGGGYQQGCHA